MPEQLSKLRPDRDLQCYFQQPSAIAALSESSAGGFTVSGCWRQQFDWAVVEWNRDNVFEHPSLRNLPDGDLSRIQLTYEETRSNCIPFDSTTYDGLGWSYLRIWAQVDETEQLHWVPLRRYATPVQGNYIPAAATLELEGSLTSGDQIELSWLDHHYSYIVDAGDTALTALTGLAAFINSETAQNGVQATAGEEGITLTCHDPVGANANRVGIYGTVHGARTESWSPEWAMFESGASPQRWQVHLDFGNLVDRENRVVPAANIRRIRWTWAADLQFEQFSAREFEVTVSNWQVSGAGAGYRIAGPGSRRIEDDASQLTYSGPWTEDRGNYSGGSIRYTKQAGALVRCTYTSPMPHLLYLGSRYVDKGGTVRVQVDGAAPVTFSLNRALEDVLIRLPLGSQTGATEHTVTITHTGPDGTEVYFDFLEIAVPAEGLPSFATNPTTTLATDWDTNHTIALAPERTAWLISHLGFRGRANHYAGAMWFYELKNPGARYATAHIDFAGVPQFGDVTELAIAGSVIQHRNLVGDTSATIAKCFELLIAAGSSAVWAKAEDSRLTITSRAMGEAGNAITVAANTHSTQFTAEASGTTLKGGLDGLWLTDLQATPRLNRAARDWSRSYFRALRLYGIEVTAGFSMELQHGDDTVDAGIAQRYVAGPCWVKTPALQTNFGPSSTAFWRQVYLDMAAIMSEAGVTPYLQFGEVQWWYFGDGKSMPFYDDYTKQSFLDTYNRVMAVIPSEKADPALYVSECEFLPTLIGRFTDAVMDFVRSSYAQARFEVLYAPDVNDTPLNKRINLPVNSWTASNLDCLKTENFTYTGDRDLNKARDSIKLPGDLAFAPGQSSHLIGIGDYTTPWNKERRLATGAGLESVVLFALDQFCLVGYGLPLEKGPRRARLMGV